MTATTRHQQALYLDHAKAKLLDELSAQTRIPKAALLREAVGDLLVKHGKLKATPRKKSPSHRPEEPPAGLFNVLCSAATQFR